MPSSTISCNSYILRRLDPLSSTDAFTCNATCLSLSLERDNRYKFWIDIERLRRCPRKDCPFRSIGGRMSTCFDRFTSRFIRSVWQQRVDLSAATYLSKVVTANVLKPASKLFISDDRAKLRCVLELVRVLAARVGGGRLSSLHWSSGKVCRNGVVWWVAATHRTYERSLAMLRASHCHVRRSAKCGSNCSRHSIDVVFSS